MTSLREEIIDILKDVYYNNDGGDPFDGPGDADRIISLIEKRIDNELHELEMRTYDLEDLGEDDATNETLDEYKIWKKVKEMLK